MAELHVLGTGGATPTAERDNTAFALDFCARYLDLFELRRPNIRMQVEFTAVEPGVRFPVNDALEAVGVAVPHTPASLAFHLYIKEESYGGEWIFPFLR